MTLTLVAAVGDNGVIGRDGGLPWERTGDLAHFKALTTGHVLLMGRRTYDSIGRPLPDRTSVVVTRQRQWEAPAQVVVCHDVDTAVSAALALDDEVFVIGGAEVYRQTLSRADRLVLTWVHQSPAGDTWFPSVDWDAWQETRREPQPGFDIVTYTRR